ncbi:MAG: DUF433 domain-containing protein [Methanotrichaceae archaeon]
MMISEDLDHVLADNYAATVSILSLHHPFDIFSAGIIKAESIYVTVMSWQEHIVADPKVLAGKPVIKGTRLAVEFVLDLLARGWSEAEILQNYPRLTHEDIQACLSYASA